MLQALLGFTSETRFLRHAEVHLRPWFPYIPHQSGYNKRLRKAEGQLRAVIRLLATDTERWDDDTWVMDSTPVECGRSRPTALRSDLAGWASYGYCASHSRWFWGLRLHLVCTPAGLPVTFALANPKIDEREVARDLFEAEPALLRPGQRDPRRQGLSLRRVRGLLGRARRHLRPPAHKSDRGRTTSPFLKPLRQLIESVNATLKTQLDLERHGGRTPGGVIDPGPPASARPDRRHLAQRQDGSTTAAILVAYDHG